MFQIVTRTGRTVKTNIHCLNNAIQQLKLLEFHQKQAGIYNPGYYKIEKCNDAPSSQKEAQ